MSKYPKKCIDCEGGEYKVITVTYASINNKGDTVFVPNAEILQCDKCEEILIPAKTSKLISNYEKG